MKNKEINIGIEILRIFLCFEIVLCHFGGGGSNILYNLRVFAAPVFMMISFSLVDFKNLNNKKRIVHRMKRLIIPFFIWNIIYFIVLNIINYPVYNHLNPTIFGGFFMQMLFGHSYNASLWFTVDMIWITILYILLFNIIKKNNFKYVLFLLVLSIILQYTNLNGNLFGIMGIDNPNSLYYYTIGRFFEMLPYACIGYIIKEREILIVNKSNKYLILVISILIIFGAIKSDLFNTPLGYGYQGLYSIINSIAIYYIFVLTPNINNKLFRKMVLHISSCTMGAYYIHRLVAILCEKHNIYHVLGIDSVGISSSIIVFIISIIIIRIIKAIPSNFIKEYI